MVYIINLGLRVLVAVVAAAGMAAAVDTVRRKTFVLLVLLSSTPKFRYIGGPRYWGVCRTPLRTLLYHRGIGKNDVWRR